MSDIDEFEDDADIEDLDDIEEGLEELEGEEDEDEIIEEEDGYETDSTIEEPEIDFNDIPANDIQKLVKIADDNRMTSNILSNPEFVKVVSIRAQQIANGDTEEPIIFVDGSNIMKSASLEKEREIAEKEIREKRCPYKIRRFLPPNLYEEWDINDMIIVD